MLNKWEYAKKIYPDDLSSASQPSPDQKSVRKRQAITQGDPCLVAQALQ